MQIRHLILFIAILIAKLSLAQPQVTTKLVAENGVKKTQVLQFLVLNDKEIVEDFAFTNFEKNGIYSNPYLYSSSNDIDTGRYAINITLKGDDISITTDSLIIDNTIARVEIFIYLSALDSTKDYVKKIKTLYYLKNPTSLELSFINTPKIGSPAAFKIKNLGNSEIYGYPNASFFFGTLYIEGSYKDSWGNYYPPYIDIKFCDTTALAIPLKMNQISTAWTPNNSDCSKYIFSEAGHYFFELFYSKTNEPLHGMSNKTEILKWYIYRQIIEFTI